MVRLEKCTGSSSRSGIVSVRTIQFREIYIKIALERFGVVEKVRDPAAILEI